MAAPELPRGLEPLVHRGAHGVVHGVRHAAAEIVPAHDDVANLEDVDRVLEHAAHVQIGGLHLVGDVAVHEELAGAPSR